MSYVTVLHWEKINVYLLIILDLRQLGVGLEYSL